MFASSANVINFLFNLSLVNIMLRLHRQNVNEKLNPKGDDKNGILIRNIVCSNAKIEARTHTTENNFTRVIKRAATAKYCYYFDGAVCASESSEMLSSQRRSLIGGDTHTNIALPMSA